MKKQCVIFTLFLSLVIQNINLCGTVLKQKKNPSLQAPITKIDLNKKSLEQVNNMCDLIIFSFDRPMQLWAYLESIYIYIVGIHKIFVIYRTSTDAFEKAYEQVKIAFPEIIFLQQQNKNPTAQFKPLLLETTFSFSTSNYVVFGVDDIIVTDYVDINACLGALAQEKAYGFFLRIGKNITKCYTCGFKGEYKIPPLKEIKNFRNIFLWKFAEGVHGWSYIHTVDMTIYAKKDIKDFLYSLEYKTPNQLEGRWAKKVDRKKKGLCFERSKMVNIPINRVQNDYHNMSMNLFSTGEMLDLFNQGKRIDISPFFQIKNQACHMETDIHLYIPQQKAELLP